MNASDAKQKFEEQKNYLIDTTLLAASVLGLILVVVTLASQGSEIHIGDLYSDILAMVFIFGVYFARKKLSLKTKTSIILVIIFSFVIIDSMQYGIYAIDKMLLVLIPFLSILVFSPRVTLFISTASIGSYLVMGYLITMDALVPVYHLSPMDKDFVSWIDSTFIAAIVAFAITTFVHRFNTSLFKTFGDLDQHNKLLTERDELLTRITNNIPRTYITVIDSSFRIVFAGGQAFHDSQLDPKNLINTNVFDLLKGQDTNASKQFEQAYISTLQGQSITTEIFLNDRFLLLKTIPLRIPSGEIESALSVVEDITEYIKTDRLLKENLKEKEVMLQEIHHRVKNNLAVVSGLMELQSYNSPSPDVQYILRKSTNRIMSIAKVHEMLYESNNFSDLPFDRYVDELVQIILSSMNFDNHTIDVQTNIRVQNMNINHGVPLGIIFNELITNSLKYGFVSQDGNAIKIIVADTNDRIHVEYEDNGKGIENFEEAASKSLGFTLITSLMKQIDAEYSYHTHDGFRLTFSFPNI
jgi:two-component sensor histidine kinase